MSRPFFIGKENNSPQRRRERKGKKMITKEKDFRGFDSRRDIVDIDMSCMEAIDWFSLDKSFENKTVLMNTPRHDRGKSMFGIGDFDIKGEMDRPINEGKRL